MAAEQNPATPAAPAPQRRATLAAFESKLAEARSQEATPPASAQPKDDQAKPQTPSTESTKTSEEPRNDAPPPAEDFADRLKPDPQDTEDIAKLKRDLLSGFHKGRKKDSSKAAAAESRAKELEDKLATLVSWDPISQRYNSDPKFREKFIALLRGEVPDGDGGGAQPPARPSRVPELQEYLDKLSPEDRESTLKFVDVIKADQAAELKQAQTKIQGLESKLDELASGLRRESDERIIQASAQQEKQFLDACPEFTKLPPALAQAFVTHAKAEVAQAPAGQGVDVVKLFKSFHADLQQAHSEHTNAELERLKAQAGKTPPPSNGTSASEAVRFSSPREAFNAILAKQRSS